MKKSVLLILFSIFMMSCGTSRSAKKYTYKKPSTTNKSANLKKLNSSYSGNVSGTRASILDNAENYLGTPYKYAGNTPAGFDCSGLVCKVFDEEKIQMPRRSSDQAKQGRSINVSEARPGDLLFFATAGGSAVTHVGIVHDILNSGEVTFIHASTSKGVIISSLNEAYWNKAFLFARSVL
ncbi:C40 family peptidase [Epilithonimonas hungarica]|uniref:Cell wall-associated hydrolase, NlpC family n=1 Tax=Epilithonimonas hungarica TaxID=454006 RepID=A0A1G7MN76_9FLAO|nr:C40 family peptidase [Epilithonimonas hungarica]SDF63232.1 Cell wall-associated hydrolase, NlpC family [Epilithonimonas hungarica]